MPTKLPPQLSSSVPMVCKNCSYRGIGKIPGRIIFLQQRKAKCPKCGKRAFVPEMGVILN